MLGCRVIVASVALVAAVLACEPPALAQAQPSALERLNAPGPEAESLGRMVGEWDVVMTFQVSPR